LLDERVALKFLGAEVLLRADVVARFAQEGRAAAKLKSERVARVIDVGEIDSVPYIVMQYLDGQNLEEVVAARGPLPIAEAADLVIQACEGITDAHARGIIPRDIKPANLFLTEREGWPTLKILDFGISKAALTASPSPFALGQDPVNTISLLGSPHYMSPEQLRSAKDVDRRTDIWSLGVVLFELLTGRTAFVSTDLFTLAREIFDAPHTPLRALRPDAPAELERVIDRALAKNADDRFQSAGELALMLLDFTTSKRSRVIATRAISVTQKAEIDVNLPLRSAAPSGSSGLRLVEKIPSAPRLPVIISPAESHARTPLTLAPVEAAPSRNRLVVPLVAAVIVLSVGIGALFFTRTKEPASAVTASATAVAATPVSVAATVTEVPAASAGAGAVAVGVAVAVAVAVPTPALAPAPAKPSRAVASVTMRAAVAPSAKPSAEAPELDIRRAR
jgi:serine/threonine protein kinase